MISIEEIKRIRETLHSIPECSRREKETARTVINYLEEHSPDALYTNLGGYGIVAGYTGSEPGPTIMFRCEMDAVKTEEEAEHLCGHDGHMATMIAFSKIISSSGRRFKGTAYLLFQPAEETGEGAALMLKDLEATGISFDYAFAYHNNPQYPLHTVIIHEGTYAAASVGMEIYFKGRSAHAAHPEQANTPFEAIRRTAEYIRRLNYSAEPFRDFVLATIVNISIGEENYGVTPGDGYLRVTLRAFDDTDLETFCDMIANYSSQMAEEYGLQVSFARHDRFPATVNNAGANEMVIRAARRAGLDVTLCKEPLRGSDDFAFFATSSLSSFFDIGNPGVDIHCKGYRFDDRIIETALKVYKGLLDFPL